MLCKNAIPTCSKFKCVQIYVHLCELKLIIDLALYAVTASKQAHIKYRWLVVVCLFTRLASSQYGLSGWTASCVYAFPSTENRIQFVLYVRIASMHYIQQWKPLHRLSHCLENGFGCEWVHFVIAADIWFQCFVLLELLLSADDAQTQCFVYWWCFNRSLNKNWRSSAIDVVDVHFACVCVHF